MATHAVASNNRQGAMDMADILHRVGIKSPPNDVYKAWVTHDGPAARWANDTQGEGQVGGWH